MPEDINALIEKIQLEGVEVAEAKAREIEVQAKKEAEAIIAKARYEAQNILSKAKTEAVKIEESTKSLLKQAGRDLLLNLKKEINATLEKIVSSHTQQALNPAELLKIINALIKDYCSKEAKGSIVVSISKADLEKLEKSFASELKEEIKKGVTIKASEDISGGLTISYDAGKSHFDFTDKAITEYITAHLKPKLAEVLK